MERVLSAVANNRYPSFQFDLWGDGNFYSLDVALQQGPCAMSKPVSIMVYAPLNLHSYVPVSSCHPDSIFHSLQLLEGVRDVFELLACVCGITGSVSQLPSIFPSVSSTFIYNHCALVNQAVPNARTLRWCTGMNRFRRRCKDVRLYSAVFGSVFQNTAAVGCRSGTISSCV